jgi:hypothetical protein
MDRSKYQEYLLFAAIRRYIRRTPQAALLPTLQAALRQVGVVLPAPFRKASAQAAHSWSPVLGRVLYRIDTVLGQLTNRCRAKRVWARDLWHLRNRLLRMVLMHTVCVLFNLQDQAPPLQLDRLVA